MIDPKDRKTWERGRPYVELGLAVLVALVNVARGEGAEMPRSYFDDANSFLDEFERRNGWTPEAETDGN